ncbi:L-iditol 2-dehydrogenase/L-idonate 5-dehydrogenase [Agreia bicolorata]|uniref:L-iditol 2-dehydrogenase/L-idonate 5-dehydrogenase n=1 Tax=Agreia bicolorata TaxID=110935 RepID=A0A1T4YFW5_9MICO|nr:L-idonate 5-dehydrogenase [Agreia bicolorata]SKB00181.1 L-iditol 2-dehydrogenase/L-idonate 5-dehydrogenase [Agreia bicolorata]
MSSDTAPIPATTSAVVAHRAGDLRLDEIVIREPLGDETVVKIAYGGICGSDLHYWRHGAAGQSILREPMVLGHEVVGTVVRAAADGSGPVVGVHVAVHPATPGAGDGARYPVDQPNLSPGCTYLGSAARLPHEDGAFAGYAVLRADMLRPLPVGLPLRRAALAEPASVAWHAVSRAGSIRGRRVLVIGAGPIGALIVAVAARAGATDIVVTDLSEEPLKRAIAVGATRTLLATDETEISRVDADVVFESSGSHRGLGSAINGATRGGTVVMVGLLPAGEQPVHITTAITRELTLVGSFRFNSEIDEVIAALADGSLQVDPIITHEFAIDQSFDAFQTASDPARSGKVLLKFGDEGHLI